MIAKFILIAMTFGHGPQLHYDNLGEYYDLHSCLAAGKAAINSAKEFESASRVRVVCVAKGEKL